MKYRGHIEGGLVVLDMPIRLPEGTVVEIPLDSKGKPVHPAFLIGDLAIDMDVSDLGSNIDHYLYGHPKVEKDRE